MVDERDFDQLCTKYYSYVRLCHSSSLFYLLLLFIAHVTM